ncbi:MAG: nucleotide sugar dehydrogenase, partial [Candidatus Micrarchaeota archaeon]|nr:nucleotide sugar dehydrogenase [Candidatus Micrarchaeota archaeon]
IGNICKTMGIDVYEVAEGMGYDKRIGKSFLRAGCGFGGSCLPKDVKALTHEARKKGYEPKLLEAVMKLNEKQPLMLVDLAERKIGVKGKTFALLGLAFKPDCDDVRESSALTVARELAARGANVIAYDPQAMGNAKKAMEKEGIRIKYAKSAKEAVDEADAVLIVTEWGEFANPKLYIGKPVFDGRNVFNGRIPKFLDYEGICW